VNLHYYLYTNIPGAGKGWTLAVLATGRRDADDYVKLMHPGATCKGKLDGPKIKADCGAVAYGAQAVLKNSMDLT
jgi:hypothetical protein